MTKREFEIEMLKRLEEHIAPLVQEYFEGVDAYELHVDSNVHVDDDGRVGYSLTSCRFDAHNNIYRRQSEDLWLYRYSYGGIEDTEYVYSDEGEIIERTSHRFNSLDDMEKGIYEPVD